MEYTYIHNHQSQFIELIRDCQTYLSISDLSLNFLKGITPTYVESSCVEVINQACVTWDGIDFSNVKYQNSESSFAKGILNSDDLLLTMTGRGTLGRCNIFFPENDDITYIADSHISILRVNKTLVLPIIIAKFISLSDTQDEIYRNYVTGSTNQLDIVFSKIKNFKIPVPPMALQEEFAAIVSQADKSKFDGFKSQFIEMFGNPITGWKYPVTTLGDCFKIGTGGTPSRENSSFYDGIIPWVKSTEVNYNYINDTEEHLSKNGVDSSNCKLYPVGTVLMAMYGQGSTRGRVAVLEVPATVNQAIAAIQIYDEDESAFVFNILTILYSHIRDMAIGGNQKNLNLKLVSQIPYIKVPSQKRKEFDAIVRQADKSKYYVQNKQNYICHILTNQIQ